MSRRIVVVVAATVLVASGCGEGGHKRTASLHQLGQTYLRIVAPANAAHDRWVRKEISWNAKTGAKREQAETAPYIAALEKADNALLRVHWPASISADVKALVVAEGVSIKANLKSIGTPDYPKLPQATEDLIKVDAAALKVRADLKLPRVG